MDPARPPFWSEMTGTQIINNAFTELGLIAAGESPASGDSTFGLEKLNRLLTGWATQRRMVFVMNHASYAFGSSKQSYTIGPAATTPDFTATRPVKIERANVILVAGDPDVRAPLEVINTSDYASLGIPALSAEYPSKLYYQPTVSKGTLWPWPYPTNTANKLELFTWNQLAEIAVADVGVDYPLPPGYDEAIILSLAESLCPAYGKQVSPELARMAQRARAAIAELNHAPPKTDLSGGLGGDGGSWSRSDFLSGGFN